MQQSWSTASSEWYTRGSKHLSSKKKRPWKGRQNFSGFFTSACHWWFITIWKQNKRVMFRESLGELLHLDKIHLKNIDFSLGFIRTLVKNVQIFDTNCYIVGMIRGIGLRFYTSLIYVQRDWKKSKFKAPNNRQKLTNKSCEGVMSVEKKTLSKFRWMSAPCTNASKHDPIGPYTMGIQFQWFFLKTSNSVT